MDKGDILNGAWRLETKLSDGATSVTWRGHAETVNPAGLPEGAAVVVKALSFNALGDWKVFDLWKREVKVLKGLDHPAIPRLYDDFSWSEGGVTRFGLVMEAVDGVDLQKTADSGHVFTETEVTRLVAELLKILSYLHAFRPPVVHRDVSPKNLIRRADGSIALVDFSGVQDAINSAYRGTSTVVGTPGYAPMEQLMGKAGPRSDLYAAAATAAFLLTKTHPADLPTDGLKIDLRKVVELSPPLGYVLDSYLQPDEKNRSLPVDDAVAILEGKKPVPKRELSRVSDAAEIARQAAEVLGVSFDAEATAAPAHPIKLPSDSKLVVDETESALTVVIPPAGIKNPATAGIGIFTFMWFGILAFQAVIALSMQAWFFLVFQIPFWGVGVFLMKSTLAPTITKTTLLLDATTLTVSKELLGKTSIQTWPVEDLGRCVSGDEAMKVNGKPINQCVLEAGTKKVAFGSGLSRRELDYLAWKLNDRIFAAERRDRGL